MSKVYFIVALILIAEVSFRLWPSPPKDENGNYLPAVEYHFYIFSPEEKDSARWIAYHTFEHLKVIGFVLCLSIVFSRYRWLLWLFVADLVVYLLNYYSHFTYVWGIPIGMDTIKLAIFGAIVIRESLDHYYGTHPRVDRFSHTANNDSGDVLQKVRTHTYKSGVKIFKASVPGDSDRRKA